MALHINYETGPEAKIDCLVDGRLVENGQFADRGVIPDDPDDLKSAFKIAAHKSMQLAADDAGNYNLLINDRCRLVNIPRETENYTISGRSPLRWAIDVLTVNQKKLKETGLVDDPNLWHQWSGEPFELIRHLRRLIYLSLRSVAIISQFPAALDDREVDQ